MNTSVCGVGIFGVDLVVEDNVLIARLPEEGFDCSQTVVR